MADQDLPLSTIPAAKDYMLASFRQFESIVGDKEKCGRYFAIFLNCLEKEPKLLKCSRSSLRNALVEAARLDLEPNSVQQLAFLIPYGRVCQLQTGYRGLCQLVLREGGVRAVWSRAVYKGDKVIPHEGTRHVLVHEPKDPWHPETLDDLVGCYAVAQISPDVYDYELMGLEELNKIRAMSKSDAWEKWPIEMHKKAPLKRLCKRLPLKGPEWKRFLELEERDGVAPDPEPPGVISNEPVAETFNKPEGKLVQTEKPEPMETRDELNDRIDRTWAYLKELDAQPQLKKNPPEHYRSPECGDGEAQLFADFLVRTMLDAEREKGIKR